MPANKGRDGNGLCNSVLPLGTHSSSYLCNILPSASCCRNYFAWRLISSFPCVQVWIMPQWQFHALEALRPPSELPSHPLDRMLKYLNVVHTFKNYSHRINFNIILYSLVPYILSNNNLVCISRFTITPPHRPARDSSKFNHANKC